MANASSLGDVRTHRGKDVPRVVDMPSDEATAWRCGRMVNLVGCIVLVGTAFAVGVWSATAVR